MNCVRTIAASIVALLAGIAAANEPTKGPQPLRILFIGSSLTYTNGLPGAFAGVARWVDAAQVVEFSEATLPMASLRRHWEGRGLDLVREARWDYVVLQPGFESKPGEYTRRFDAEIRKAGAKTILFMTWTRPRDESGQKELDDAFVKAGKELGAIVAPVGPAWRIAMAKRPGIGLYASDDLHPSAMGTYLAACVFYSTLFGRPVPPSADLTEVIASEAAWESVLRYQPPK